MYTLLVAVQNLCGTAPHPTLPPPGPRPHTPSSIPVLFARLLPTPPHPHPTANPAPAFFRRYGPQRPRLPGSLGAAPYLSGTVAGDYGFDPAGFSSQPQAFARWAHARTRHCRGSKQNGDTVIPTKAPAHPNLPGATRRSSCTHRNPQPYTPDPAQGPNPAVASSRNPPQPPKELRGGAGSRALGHAGGGGVPGARGPGAPGGGAGGAGVVEGEAGGGGIKVRGGGGKASHSFVMNRRPASHLAMGKEAGGG